MNNHHNDHTELDALREDLIRQQVAIQTWLPDLEVSAQLVLNALDHAQPRQSPGRRSAAQTPSCSRAPLITYRDRSPTRRTACLKVPRRPSDFNPWRTNSWRALPATSKVGFKCHSPTSPLSP